MQKILDIPYIPQKPLYCGLACLSMVLKFQRREFSQDDLAKIVTEKYGYEVADTRRDDPGIDYWQLATIPSLLGFKVQATYNLTMDDIANFIDNDKPIIARHHWGNESPANNAHFVVLRGYDAERKSLFMHDPYYSDRTEEELSVFQSLWDVHRHKWPSKNYGIIIF